MASDSCLRVEEKLAEFADGGEVPSDLREHLSGCAECSAKVEQARRTAKWLGEAASSGGEIEVPLDRLLREAERRRSARRVRAIGWAGGVAAVAAAVALVVWIAVRSVAGGGEAAGDAPTIQVAAADTAAVEPAPVEPTPVVADGSVRGHVRAVRAPAGAGIEVETGGEVRRFTAGDPLPALAGGSRIATDDRTVATVELADGSRIMLNRGTELAFDATDRNLLRVARGEVLADVIPRRAGEPRLRIEVPTGTVSVLGTKFGLAAGDDESRVDVARGEVEVRSKEGKQALARAGEEATLPNEGTPTVVPVRDLSEVLAWSEDLDDTEKPARGLGSLRAHPPGRDDQDRPLALESHKVTVRIQGQVARTEVEEVFRNDTGNRLEGVYRFPLPPGASIARLALEVDGKLEEGAFVESDRAGRIWAGVIRNATPTQQRRAQQEFIWVPGPWRDPALLQWQKGNQFELRIFPIEARSSRRVIIAYTEVLRPVGSHRRYVYPLPFDEGGSTKSGTFSFEARLAGIDGEKRVRSLGYDVGVEREGDVRVARFDARDFAPTGDLVLDFALPERSAGLTAVAYRPEAEETEPAAGRRGDGPAPARDDDPFVLLAVRPDLPLKGDPVPRDLVVIVDSSYSTFGEIWSRQGKLVRTLIEEMDGRDRFALLACDVECRQVTDGLVAPSARAADDAAAKLAAIEPGGGTDVVGAFEAAAALLHRRGTDANRAARVIYVGDGIASAGEIDAGRIADGTAAALDGLSARVTTVGIGVETDDLVLRSAARRGGGTHIAFVPGRSVRAEALSVLSAQYGAALEDAVLTLPDGLERVEPSGKLAVRAGDELLVLARMGDGVDGEIVLKGKVGGEDYEQRYRVDLRPDTARGNAFVPRLWAEARIEALTLADPEQHKDEIVALSEKYRVLSRYTSLLVLESAAMYRAFGIDRPEPASDWTGEESIVEQSFGGLVDHAPPEEPGGGGGVDWNNGDTAARGRAGGWAAGPRRSSAAPMAAAESSGAAMDDLGALGSVDAQLARRERMPAPRPSGQWMRRTWVREATVGGAKAPLRWEERRVEQYTEALEQNRDSRDRHRMLYLALSRVGELGKALDVAESWWARDRLDPEALERMAEIEVSRGRADRAVRLIGGLADLQPREASVHERLAAMYDAAGRSGAACAHRRALAALRPDDADALAAAHRCLVENDRGAAAEALVDRVENEMTRSRLRARLAESVVESGSVGRDLRIEADWDGVAELDLVLVHPDGRRSSWIGGVTGIAVKDADARREERIGLRTLQQGAYRIEVVRRDSDDSDRTVSGTLRIRAMGTDRRIRFTIGRGETRVSAASIDVTRREVLVPTDTPPTDFL